MNTNSGEREHEVDVRGRRLDQLGGDTVGVGVLHGQHRQPVGDQDEAEQRDRQRQHERGDLHADRALDLVAHLDGDRLEEQLHAAGHTGRGDLGAQEERQGDDDDAGDGGGQHGVHVDRQAEPLLLDVVTNLERRARLQSSTNQSLSYPSLDVEASWRGFALGTVRRSFFMNRQGGAQHENHLEQCETEEDTEAHRAWKTNAMVKPTTVIANSRVAELSAIFFLSGWSSAVIDSTARRTNSALSRPKRHADAEEQAEQQVADERGGHRDQAGERHADDEAGERPECHGREHQRRVLRWRRHCFTSIPRSSMESDEPVPMIPVRAVRSVSEGVGRAGITQGAAPVIGKTVGR